MRLRTLGLALILTTTWSARASAQGPEGRPFGLGIILGEPSGITAKVWFSEENALDIHMAFDFTDDAFAIFVDYLFHWQVFGTFDRVELPLYVGIGGKLVFDDHNRRHRDDDDDLRFGIRVPVGLDILFKSAPIEVFLEVAPGIRVVPDTEADVDGGVGIRFYF